MKDENREKRKSVFVRKRKRRIEKERKTKRERESMEKGRDSVAVTSTHRKRFESRNISARK